VRGKPHATFEAAGAGNVIMAAGLRAIAKAMEHPPEPNIGAPALDPTVQNGPNPNGVSAEFPHFSSAVTGNSKQISRQLFNVLEIAW